jgi:DNA-binding beta-propeller fold protein YncE
VPYSLAFNNDGTKMFVGGASGQDINEYNLSTAFDISTASYSQNFSVATQDSAPKDIAFNSDGTVMLILGLATDTIYEYTLTTGFDLSTASYSSTSFSVASQLSIPTGMALNNDGTKMFVVGNTTDSVFEYTLTTGFDISTASYSSVSFSVASQESSPTGVTFDSVGSKMFILGTITNEAVYEYDLSSRLSLVLGSGSFASADVGKTIEANSGAFVLTATNGSISTTTAPTSYSQVASGSWEMYAVVYNTTDGDLELSGNFVGFTVSSASYVQNFSISSQETQPTGLAFSTDGTKMFVCGLTGDDVNEYTLSTAFDISTASFVDSFSVLGQESYVLDLAFNTDGTKMFVCGASGQDVNEYTLSTGFDVSTASFVDSFSVASQETQPEGLTFNNDGTKMYIAGGIGDDINEFTLSTGFDVSTASYTRKFYTGTQDLSPTAVAFNSDGTKMFVVGAGNDNVYEYNLSTGFDVSTSSYLQSFSVATEDTTPAGIAFNTAGDKMFILGFAGQDVNEYSVGSGSSPSGYHAVHTTTSTDSTYWTDVNSMTADEAAGNGAIYYAVSTDDRTTWKIAKGTDGERSIVRNNAGTWQYNSNGTYGSTTWSNAATNTELAALQEAMEGAEAGYNLSNASYDSVSFSTVSQDTEPQGLIFKPDGTKMYMLGGDTDTVYEYDLSTAFDITTASYQRSKSVTTEDINPTGIAFNSDGTKMYITGNVNDSVFQYSLSTAYDVSTASYDSVSFSVTSQDTAPWGLWFNSNGTKMFVGGDTGNDVNEYALSTGFDITTASFSQNFSVSAQETNVRQVAFSSDGTNMFVVGTANDQVHKYTLSTGFDVSTASYTQSFSVNSQETNPQGLAFNADGTKMFVIGRSNDLVLQYSVPDYINQMNKTQLDAVPDANHFTLGNDLDLAIIFNLVSGTTVPSSDGVSINFDANSLNQGAILGTDYNWDFPASNKVRITSLAAQNLKVRII